MLASAETIEMVEKTVTKHNIPCLVVDPVRTVSNSSLMYFLQSIGNGLDFWRNTPPQ